MPQPEARLVKQAQKYLDAVGARSFKIHGDDVFQEIGIPDLLGCYQGRFYGLEAKIPPNQPSAVQKLVLRQIREAGGVGAVFTSVAEVKNLLTYDPGWIAGFYEGEGTIDAREGRLRVRIYQNDSSPLRYIQGYFGGGLQSTGKLSCFVLSIGKQGEVMRFLETVGPLLKSEYKRKQLRTAVRKVEEATGESLRLRGYSSRDTGKPRSRGK
jgi:hypothetical protein